MKIMVASFKGLAPITSPTKLPDGYATTCVNAKLVSGDLASFAEIGNFYTLAKTAPINTIWQIGPLADRFYLQWAQSEVSYGTNIDVSYGTIPGDTTYRTFMSGLSGGPKQTNLFYATDPSQQGVNVQYAYPYVTFPVGIEDPPAAPSAVAAPPAATPQNFHNAALTYVNSAVINAAGTGYKLGDILTGTTGTVVLGLGAFQLEVSLVDPTTGAITGFALIDPGQYEAGLGPSTVAVPVVGGAGSGATVNLTVVNLSTFQGFSTWEYDNGGGSYSHWSPNPSGIGWESSTGQGSGSNNLSAAWDIAGSTLATAQRIVFQADILARDDGSGHAPNCMWLLGGQYNGAGFLSGPTLSVSNYDGGAVLSDANGPIDSVSMAFPWNTFYRVVMTATLQTAATTGTNPIFNVVATIATQAAPTVILATLQGNAEFTGEYYGVGQEHKPADSSEGNTTANQNVILSVQQQITNFTSEATAYVYTYQTTYGAPPNAILQESGPSDPSGVVTFYLVPNSVTGQSSVSPITVTVPAAPSGLDISAANLYRLVQTTSGEVYEYDTQLTVITLTGVVGAFVVGEKVTGGTSSFTGTVLVIASSTLTLSAVTGNPEVGETVTGAASAAHGVFSTFALDTTAVVYTDTLQDSDLGKALVTADFLPPPADLQGLVALPNGIMAGFFANTLCLSAQNYPYAFPVGNQLSTDYAIVAIAPIDTTVVVLTLAGIYTAWGNDPSSYNMSKETAPVGCVSKRSVAVHRSAGVIFAGPSALWAYRGQGQLLALTDTIFDNDQWGELNPASIIGVVHDDQYYFWYTTLAGVKGGYAVDLRPGGFKLIALDFHVTSVYLEPVADGLQFTPDFSVYDIDGAPVAVAQNKVCQWEYDTSSLRPRTWGRSEILFSRPCCFQLVRVYAESYVNLTLTIVSEGGTAFSGTVTSARPFIIAPKPGRKWSVSVTGPDQVNSIEIVESSAELTS
jgi:hypothetical protein